MLESELRINVLDAFTALTRALDALAEGIAADHPLIAWVHDQDLSLETRAKAIRTFQQLHYLDDQAPREIIILAGFLGATKKTLELATQVNVCKDHFKHTIIALKTAKILPTDPWLMNEFDQRLTARSANTANTLQRLGLVRLHLKQCYRKIPILQSAPYKISWTWAHTKSIKKINVAKAEELLLKKGNDAGILLQLQKLVALNPKESLAVVQELAPHLRANIVYADNNHQPKRSMIKGPVPILFPCDEATPYPKFNPPSEKCLRSENRSQRSDVRLEPTPYLPAIRAHRYMET